MKNPFHKSLNKVVYHKELEESFRFLANNYRHLACLEREVFKEHYTKYESFGNNTVVPPFHRKILINASVRVREILKANPVWIIS